LCNPPPRFYSEDDGTFTIAVEGGTYDITIEKTGYQTVTLPGVDLSAADDFLADPVEMAPL